ncbi:MAG: AraC family transcriptional regulator [Clostridiales bacterium]|nr:AraC family transcriptional regulator [Clostridiales bacterium]
MAEKQPEKICIIESDRYRVMEGLQATQILPAINPVTLHFFGAEQCTPGQFFGPHVRSYYLIHVVRSGRGRLSKNGKSWEIRAGQAFLIYPGEETFYQADSEEPWYYMWMGFHGIHMEEMMDRAGFSPDSPIVICKNVEEICSSINHLFELDEVNYETELFRMAELYRLLGIFIRDSVKPEKDGTEDLRSDKKYVEEAMNILIHSGKKKVCISEVAREIGVSRGYLTKIFKREMKVSPQEFLMDFRMDRAKNLLCSSGESISVIAMEVGYSDVMSFSKTFRQHFGVSPTEYRRIRRISKISPVTED